jgi:hypothetical protein
MELLCLINQTSYHEDVWGNGSISPPFLTSALDGGEWSALRSCRFNPWERARGTWVDSRTGPDAMEKRQILQCRELNTGHPTRWSSIYQLSDPGSLMVNIELK